MPNLCSAPRHRRRRRLRLGGHDHGQGRRPAARRDGWTWRAGYSYGSQPIPEKEVLFNILAPGVIEQHLTLGFSKLVNGTQELRLALIRAFSKNVKGPNPLEVPGQQTIELTMDQWELELGWSFGIKK